MQIEFTEEVVAGVGSWPGFSLQTLGGVESPSIQTQVDINIIELEFADSISPGSLWTCTADDGGILFDPPLALPESGPVIGA